MRRFSTATRLALTSSTFAIAVGFASGASAKAAPVDTTTAAPATNVTAQDVQNLPTNSTLPEQVAAASPQSGPGITVTGSRIRRPNLESPIPITSVQGEQFFRQGQTTVGDALNDLPQLRNTYAQQNAGLSIGVAGLNLLDLRGLNPKRTLVLVNGRRHVAADILSSASVPDVNTIPSDLIDRVDIVTGGNSAVYGSDAVAGVVNFVLKKDFEGVQVRAQGAEAAAGFGTNYTLAAIAGHNFNGGRGNITLAAEYSHQDRVFGSEIPWLSRVDGTAVVDLDSGLPANAHGSDGFPDRIFVRDIRLATTSLYGMIPFEQTNAASPCGRGLSNSNGAPANLGTAYNCNWLFMPDGSFVAQTGSRYTTGPNGGYIGGNGQTGREGDLLSIFPKINRYTLDAEGHYTVSDAFEPFFEAKWNHNETAGNNASPSGLTGALTAFDARERVRLDNPFLAPYRAQIVSLLTASGCAPGGTACTTPTTTSLVGPTPADPLYVPVQRISGTLTATDLALINSGVYRIPIARILDDIGIRDEKFTRDTYRGVVGVRGNFNTDWSYEISANYGEFKETDHNRGFLDKQRFMLALDAGIDPADGKIKCRAQFDPQARVPFQGPYQPVAPGVNELNPAQALAAATAKLNADIAACVPYNPVGAANNSAAAAYIEAGNIYKHSKMTQFDLNGFVNGDSSQLFELPGGPVGFVLGGEYRRETARYIDDPFVTTQLTNNVIITNFTPKPFHVSEVFGELNAPILKDQPFFHELTLSGAGRYSKYKKSVGDVWTYNVGGEWAPVRDIRFRANYGKAVRAPNFSETAFPPVANFAPNFTDPCTSPSTTLRQTNCTADLGPGGPGTLAANVATLGTLSLAVVNGSNPNLKPEVSHSLTVGAVVQPRFIPGLSASVDYFDIKVKNVINALTAQQIANLCYDSPTINNQYCALFTRYRGAIGTVGPNLEIPGQILANSLTQAGLNYAARIRRGIDASINYHARLAPKVTLDAALLWTHTLQVSDYNDPTNPKFEDRILGELGDPQDEGRLDVDLKVGQVTFGYSMHYIGSMFIDVFEDWNPLPGACPAGTDPNTCPPLNLDFANVRKYPAVSYHGLRMQWDAGPAFHLKNIQVYAGVDNVFDKHAPFNLPPGGTLTTDRLSRSQSALYDARGRNIYAGIKLRY